MIAGSYWKSFTSELNSWRSISIHLQITPGQVLEEDISVVIKQAAFSSCAENH